MRSKASNPRSEVQTLGNGDSCIFSEGKADVVHVV